MAAIDEVVEVLAQWHQAQGALLKGTTEPVKQLWSHRADVTLANPFGPAVRGWEQVAASIEWAAAQLRDGEMVSVETVAKQVTLISRTFSWWSGQRPRLVDGTTSPRLRCG
jgi:hypothetical protein